MALDVVWVATEAESGRYPFDAVTSTLDDLRARVRALQLRGEGYFEIARAGGEYPALLVEFRGGHAVVHLHPNAETMILLHGDGSVPAEEDVGVLIFEESATFTGHVVMHLDRAMNSWRNSCAAVL